MRAAVGLGKMPGAASENGRRLWARFIQESIYEVKAFDVTAAHIQAGLWTDQTVVHWSDLLHIAVAREARLTLISFDPDIRSFATTQGVHLFQHKV